MCVRARARVWLAVCALRSGDFFAHCHKRGITVPVNTTFGPLGGPWARSIALQEHDMSKELFTAGEQWIQACRPWVAPGPASFCVVVGCP